MRRMTKREREAQMVAEYTLLLRLIRQAERAEPLTGYPLEYVRVWMTARSSLLKKLRAEAQALARRLQMLEAA